jgi:arginine/lysine/ornithine decarboxylase
MDEHILQTELAAYAANGLTPLHMPGHKRRMAPAPGLPFAWDVTEVPGTDDLHDAQGILRSAMARTAALCGAARTWYLVGGSTVGLLAGIRALAPLGSEIVAARNCHKSVYHAVELGGLRPVWLMPPSLPDFEVCGSIPPAAVESALRAHPDARCVVLTSPTYEGVLSDIAGIAAVCHRFGVPLLVDEAHGAHLGLAAGWPKSAVQCGADIAVQSPHKTLPSLTQTALLHLSPDSLASADEVERQLDVFETSSPSYPLLASLDGCTGILRARGAVLFADWQSRLARFDAAAAQWKYLRVLCHGTGVRPAEVFAFDAGKLLLGAPHTAAAGPALATLLRRAGFETEMACGRNVLAMTSLCDAPDTLDRFAAALGELDTSLTPAVQTQSCALPPPGTAVCTIAQAMQQPAREVSITQAEGLAAAEYLWAYPPGIPLIAPGETVTAPLIACCAALDTSGTQLHHSAAKNSGMLRVLG